MITKNDLIEMLANDIHIMRAEVVKLIGHALSETASDGEFKALTGYFARPYADLSADERITDNCLADYLINVMLGGGDTTLSFRIDDLGRVLSGPTQPLLALFSTINIDFDHKQPINKMLDIARYTAVDQGAHD